ncbi:MAG: M48 family metalloprotease [Planctomycetes bacterium]|nr:M48 family metalloprotease [Planctomycetota bacterium]
MRIPFDLIAALIALQAVQELFGNMLGRNAPDTVVYSAGQVDSSTGEACLAILGFWIIVWLYHEAVARRTLWQVRWGRFPEGVKSADGSPRKRHPLETHDLYEAAGQASAVLLYVLVIWYFRWPLKTYSWPEWLGLQHVLSEKALDRIGSSTLVKAFLDLGPYAGAMMLSWLPKRRMAQAMTGRRIPRLSWLSLEARLTFIPLAAWFAINLLVDLLSFTGAGDAADLLNDLSKEVGGPSETLALLAMFGFLVFAAAVLMPWVMLRIFRCRPLPDGDLKSRIDAVVKRSGVKVRRILAWGPKGSGLANACVLGPWAPMRYVLISPGLTDILSPEECEAVIAHELGHARHGHLALLLAVLLSLASLSELLARFMFFKHPLAQGAVYMLLILVYLRIFFGIVMRACEREADLASAELIGSPLPLASALEKLARLSGGIRDVYSWHHDSIAKRVAVLMQDGLDPERIARYHRHMRRMSLGFLCFTAVAVFLVLGLSIAHDLLAVAATAASGAFVGP